MLRNRQRAEREVQLRVPFTVIIEAEAVGSLSELLSELKGKGGQTQASLKLELTLPGPQQKQEMLKLLDRLPIPVDGQVKATWRWRAMKTPPRSIEELLEAC